MRRPPEPEPGNASRRLRRQGALRAVIADDEAASRRHLKELLEACGVRTVAECAVGEEVLPAVLRERPDLLCLDVRMPGEGGLAAAAELAAIPPARRPQVVFVTGYVEHAAAAFELEALDYLVKPLSAGRVEQAVRRARDRSGRGEARANGRVPLLFLPSSDHSRAIPPGAIRHVEARDGACLVHSDEGTHSFRTTLARLEAMLEPFGFLRVHKAYLVNLRRVRSFVRWSRHVHTLLMDGGKDTHVPVAKSRLAAFRGSVIWISHAERSRVRGGSRSEGEGGGGRRREQGAGARDRAGAGRRGRQGDDLLAERRGNSGGGR